jgi:hypothetical protein
MAFRVILRLACGALLVVSALVATGLALAYAMSRTG